MAIPKKPDLPISSRQDPIPRTRLPLPLSVLLSLLGVLVAACGNPEPNGFCEELDGIAPAGLVAASPRAEPHLERLALALGDSLLADPETYEQVVDDVQAIRAEHPELEFDLPPYDVTAVYVVTSEDAGRTIRGGGDDEWNCLDEHFGPTHTTATEREVENEEGEVVARTMSFHVRIPRVVHRRRLADLYERLESVEETLSSGAAKGFYAPDPSSICARWGSDSRAYLFHDEETCGANSRGEGDGTSCPRLFSIDDTGVVTEETLPSEVESWADAEGFACPTDTLAL